MSETSNPSNSMRRYLVVGMPRSGTTVTHYSLKGHPAVSALENEVSVHPLFGQGITAFTYGKGTPHERALGHRALFDAVAGLNRTSETTTLGVKSALDTPELARDLVEAVQQHLPDVRVILTVRKDMLAQYASWLRAQKVGRWHARSADIAKIDVKVEVERHAFARYMIEGLQALEVLRELHGTHAVKEFSYERDISVGTLDPYYDLFEFLGLPRREITWLKSKKMSPPVEEYVTNYNEARSLHDEIVSRFAAQEPVAVLASDYQRPAAQVIWSEAQRGAKRVRSYFHNLRTQLKTRG